MRLTRKKIKWVAAALLAAFLLLQLANPSFTNPPVKTDFLTVTAAPPEIRTLIRASCYDCHSHETRWPWYSHIAPMSLAIARDVDYGRANLNLSEWPTNNPVRMKKKLESMNEDIQYGDMPLKKYTLLHREARLTDARRKQLEDWLSTQSEQLDSAAAAAAQ